MKKLLSLAALLMSASSAQAVMNLGNYACELKSSSSSKYYQCKNKSTNRTIKASHSYATFHSKASRVAEFGLYNYKQSNGRNGVAALYRYSDSSGSWTTRSSHSTYYVVHLDSSNHSPKKLSQRAESDYSDAQTLSAMKVVDGKAIWKFHDGRRNCGTACTSTHGYYMLDIAKAGGSSRAVRLTQGARGSYSDAQTISEFKVANNRAVWKFLDGERNCGTTCDSYHAYYYTCLSDVTNSAKIHRITQNAHRGMGDRDQVSYFRMSGNTASWKYYNSGSRRTTEHSEYLGVCR